MEENSILPRRLADDALPQRCDRTVECDDVLLHIRARKLIVCLDLPRNRRSQFLIEDGRRADDQFPCVFLCRDLDVAQCARTQSRPLLIAEGESAQETEEHILRAWKNPIGLVHSS